jgi:hypothetical protein
MDMKTFLETVPMPELEWREKNNKFFKIERKFSFSLKVTHVLIIFAKIRVSEVSRKNKKGGVIIPDDNIK